MYNSFRLLCQNFPLFSIGLRALVDIETQPILFTSRQRVTISMLQNIAKKYFSFDILLRWSLFIEQTLNLLTTANFNNKLNLLWNKCSHPYQGDSSQAVKLSLHSLCNTHLISLKKTLHQKQLFYPSQTFTLCKVTFFSGFRTVRVKIWQK